MLKRRHDLQHAIAARGTRVRDMVLDPRRVHVLYTWCVAALFSDRGIMLDLRALSGASIAEIVSAFPTCGGL